MFSSFQVLDHISWAIFDGKLLCLKHLQEHYLCLKVTIEKCLKYLEVCGNVANIGIWKKANVGMSLYAVLPLVSAC